MIKPGIVFGVLFIIIISFCIIGFIGDPFLFTVFFPTALIVTLFLLLTNLIWKLLPPTIRDFHSRRKVRFRVIILFFLIFSYIVGWSINYYFLPALSDPKSLLGNIGFLAFTAFFCWNLIKRPIKKIMLWIGLAAFILFVSSLAFTSSLTYNHTQLPSLEALKSLPYLAWTPAQDTIHKSGVTEYNQRRSLKGINIYNTVNSPSAYLMDMTGNVLHAWSVKMQEGDTLQHIEMCRNGDLLAIIEEKMLIRLDWDSNIKWAKKMRVHHDIAIDENQDIFVLVKKDEIVSKYCFLFPVSNEYIIILTPDGEVREEISLFEILKEKIPIGNFVNIYGSTIDLEYLKVRIEKKIKGEAIFKGVNPEDIFHANTIESINRDIKGLCKKGDLLICVRSLDYIAILDIEKKKITWGWGIGELNGPHYPTLLENGHILIFDNGMKRRNYSRIIELDPMTKEIVWQYQATPPEQFYSFSRGANQRLPNGNTLITSSDSGRVFEVTQEGEIVWEFYSQEINRDREERATIYRMMRIIFPEKYSWYKWLQ